MVIDASALLQLLFRGARASGVEARLLASGAGLFCPQLLDIEVMEVIGRYRREGTLTRERARQALRDLQGFPVTRCSHAPLLERAGELTERMPAAVAVYLALAETLGVPLLTATPTVAEIARGEGVEAFLPLPG